MPLYVPVANAPDVIGATTASLLTTGQETFPREYAASNSPTFTSGNIGLTFFTARKSETSTQVRVVTGSTQAAATPTLCRIGLYTIDASNAGTLVASVASDTALFAAAATVYTKSWSVSIAMTAGQRYALGVIVVSGAAVPTYIGQLISSSSVTTETATAPLLCARISGQTDLVGSFVAGSLVNTNNRLYAAILP